MQQDVPDGFSCQHFDCIRHGPDGFDLDLGKTFNLDNQSGLGDLFVPMMFSPNPSPGAKFGWGLGPTLLFPTATDDDLGTDTWEAGLAGVATYNAWNVPIGLMGAKTVMFGKLPIKFQFGVEKSIVRQDNFGKDWLFRFNIIPVIPSMVKTPLF